MASRALKKQGWLSSDTAELVFDRCRIPAANLLGQERRGFYALMKNLQNERIVVAAQAIGEAVRRSFKRPLARAATGLGLAA